MEDPRMKIRFGLVLMLALGLGTAGCASGGAASGDSASAARSSVPGGEALAQGERPRQTENTRAAQRHMDAGDDAEDPAEARMHYEQALEAAMAAIAEDGRNPLAHRQAALSNLALENYTAAGAHFDHASGLRPIYEFEDIGIRERAWIQLYGLAIPAVNGGDYETAVGHFENANAIYDERPEAMVTLAQLHAQLGNHDAAIENADRALAIIGSEKINEMDSATAAMWTQQAADLPMLKAQVFSGAGRFEEAAAGFRAISEANPDDVLAMRNLAGVLIRMGNEAEAFGVYDEILARPGLEAADFYTIGVGFYTGSEYGGAIEAFSGAAGLNTNDRDAIEMWARSLQLDSAYAAIPEVAARWIALDPYNQNAYLVSAQALNINGDEDGAREMIGAIDGLSVDVKDMQITRMGTGGAIVSGSVMNKSLAQGTNVTLNFTFYTAAGDAMGTVAHTVSVAGENMTEIFQVEFSSMDQVGGYGYTLTGG
jgi:tetratricopeptide (TPR) repeat protein